MASSTTDSRRMPRRDSSTARGTRSPSQRPRLLRASATEPSITTSNASRDALANSYSSRRATELLRVAYISGGSSPDALTRATSRATSPISTRTSPPPMYDSLGRHCELSSSPISNPDGFDELRDSYSHSHSQRYFSFPSFDLYESPHQEEDKEPHMKSP
ncbi:hypothetical protein GE21DRAFT_8047 [Neurospora crassa]|uniref:Uncharacterized protein n=5 Tax=Neurospora TaxID=5140 RepID=F5HIM5_NEUCR|nr:uncharacterized protein NEUTE1DRAFT_119661 [Neurospora tetrasperma FGSC 2508]XP_955973.2 hypothetical protein NCU01451 [Neurospora crassa OR74A]EGZ75535.1 hypothetical protein NEUTE2DRAFT_148649 [Neurospora tetrasperma FGSC 2509]KAK3499977.1 hypothetical protein B0T23DRAFT_31315 [Neurospora hispaniola]KHE80008.1 hypothetical protein GE21DRAFT_8047 [Neurospora crassa]EAA26737.2 hypothetical protein NCU01451 [Neurospora crassa OR74A]EGO60491.1 hypothetical protein NEUTE1DRAFT_119661 [Neurosp|eukprot:XP_955973.2 hypothetical protein NCU01451 [Neurospora crassa OR74A]